MPMKIRQDRAILASKISPNQSVWIVASTETDHETLAVTTGRLARASGEIPVQWTGIGGNRREEISAWRVVAAYTSDGWVPVIHSQKQLEAKEKEDKRRKE